MTVVVPMLSDEEEVLAFLRTAFAEVEVRKRGSTKKAPEVFRFDSTRFVGKLRALEGSPLLSEVEMIKFEIQIKSAFEHAWGVTTHALTYKGPAAKWNRLRLAAQLKASVEQLDMLVLTFEEASLRIEESSWPENDAKEDIASFFQDAVNAGGLPAELAPKDWRRFCDSIYQLTSDSAWASRKQPSEIAEGIKSAMRAELKNLHPQMVPMSISLWQLAFAALCKQNVIEPPLKRLCPIITPELEMLYPTVARFLDRFDYSDGRAE